MERMNGLMYWSYRLGVFLLELLKLQVYWLWFTLRGGIILGIFPATAAVFACFYYWFSDVQGIENFASYEGFQGAYRENFKQANQVGYIMFGILAFLFFDLRVSEAFIHSRWLHYLLLVFFALALAVTTFVFPSVIRYQLSWRDHLKQALLLVPFAWINVIAIFIGMGLALAAFTFWPALSLLVGIPAYFLPMAWFTYLSLMKLEANADQTDK